MDIHSQFCFVFQCVRLARRIAEQAFIVFRQIPQRANRRAAEW
jgi:hypothetical protein